MFLHCQHSRVTPADRGARPVHIAVGVDAAGCGGAGGLGHHLHHHRHQQEEERAAHGGAGCGLAGGAAGTGRNQDW